MEEGGVDPEEIVEKVKVALELITTSTGCSHKIDASGKFWSAMKFYRVLGLTPSPSGVRAAIERIILCIKFVAAVRHHKIVFREDEAWTEDKMQEALNTIDLDYPSLVLNPRVQIFPNAEEFELHYAFEMF